MLVVSTFSIAACDLETQEWGVAVASRFLAVGSLVPWVRAGVGAVATQAYLNPTYGPRGLELLARGFPAADVVAELTSGDTEREIRQLGVVGAKGDSAAFTGANCKPWAGALNGHAFTCQGNYLENSHVLEAMASTFARRGAQLADRLLAALDAGDAAGGDRRGRQSAALLIGQEHGGFAELTDISVNLRVDDHLWPVKELLRLYELHKRQLERPGK